MGKVWALGRSIHYVASMVLEPVVLTSRVEREVLPLYT